MARTIAAELVCGASAGGVGLGRYIFRTRNERYTNHVFAGLAAMIAIGLVVEHGVFGALDRATIRRWGVRAVAAGTLGEDSNRIQTGFKRLKKATRRTRRKLAHSPVPHTRAPPTIPAPRDSARPRRSCRTMPRSGIGRARHLFRMPNHLPEILRHSPARFFIRLAA
ncbi:ABC transporter permease [Burkholderia thailandensis]|uniref:ABC transporter permease protein n=1 Tax=Burkholderia thailandensis TaxID=57975 RepID=A0AAW9CWJ3_BURTH|nr:ABC transporter permease [Burkholderia thailandensis]MDD1479857.1 ABC transporter permease [Burkholderia thailandensis]MDD1487013.1 ABC transporter permease [Burkholderia thailandensis]MDD1492556.1 ABC transporter permease [Burkholderia thailandensis]MDW9237987.1 putative aBC transporter permease protein [Burkholderia thailandensis]